MQNETEDRWHAWCAAATAGRGEILRRIEPLRTEASHRTFYRLVTTNTTFVAMSSPPALEANDQFVTLATLFAAKAVPVPRILASVVEEGFFLLEDLGPVHFADLYGTNQETPALQAAIHTLLRIQAITDPAVAPYTVDRFSMELALFNEWFLTELLQLDGAEHLYQASYARLVAQTQEQPQVCVHRDFHCRNLLFNEDRLGVVDFQDALQGPAFYDLASLLHDCYHVFSPEAVDHWLQIFLQHSSMNIPITHARRWLDLTAIQRQIKAVGIFARLHIRDQKSSHLLHIYPLIERIIDLSHRYHETQSLTLLLETILPRARTTLAKMT